MRFEVCDELLNLAYKAIELLVDYFFGQLSLLHFLFDHLQLSFSFLLVKVLDKFFEDTLVFLAFIVDNEETFL